MKRWRIPAWLLLALPFVGTVLSAAAPAPATAPVGLAAMERLELLPFFREGVQVRYEGSIDKMGGNADWDWWLYQDTKGEWVIFDVDGPGCLYNFVQHRYPTSPEPTFRFYFDGESEPRFTIRQSEFGQKAPFLAPLAEIYTGPVDRGRGPIWVIRSFVPMPFTKSCRITSSVRLEGNRKDRQGGGWGHVVYHTYPTADGLATFTGSEDYSRLRQLWQNPGRDPKDSTGNIQVSQAFDLTPGGRTVLLSRRGEESIAAIKLKIDAFEPADLMQLWLTIRWDDEDRPAVECPIGAFFGNELGLHDMRLLTHGMGTDGTFYSYFPMPYWRSAEITLTHRGPAGGKTRRVSSTVEYKPAAAQAYPAERCGHFRATPYLARTTQLLGRDALIGRISGRGHVVAGQITGWNGICEGDVRVHIDGSATPQVESDGSESWSCYGWGFADPPQNNPSSGYDGQPDQPWSMVRVLTGDLYPFTTGLRFAIEDQYGSNQRTMDHAGVLFYYGETDPSLILTDTLDVGDPVSELAHGYRIDGQVFAGELTSFYEGDDDKTPLTDRGRAFTGSSRFQMKIDPANDGVRLRRRSDQKEGRQRARVFVDGKPVRERSWYFADHNSSKRWLDDEFDLPVAYTRGKSEIELRLEYVPAGDAKAWTEYRYQAFSHLRRTVPTGRPPADPWADDWYTVNAEAMRGTRDYAPVRYRKAPDADTIYALLPRGFLPAAGEPLRLPSITTGEQTEVTVLGTTNLPLPRARAPGQPGWWPGSDGITLLFRPDDHLDDEQRFRRPVVIRFTRSTASGHIAPP